MRKILDMKIKTRIYASYIIMVLMVIIVGTIGLQVIQFGGRGQLTEGQVVVAFRGIGIGIIMILGCAIASAVILIKSVTRPIDRLTAVANEIAEGNIDVEIPEYTYKGEIAELTEAFHVMKDTITEQARVAHEISQGNLDINITPRSSKDVLGLALKGVVDDYNILLSTIKESTSQVTTGAGQVASASQSLAQGSTEQASAIQQITASMDDIAEKTSANASKAGDAAKLAVTVSAQAENGNEKMKQMVAAMKDINDSSEEISKIIKTIDDIAFQTNILALNATVEAARAGVHGKGFAVVAEEVRNLAEKSAQAANETDEMIRNSIHKVNNGTVLAKETADSLQGIVSDVANAGVVVGEIATATSEQATAITQINQAINQVSEVVQTNSASSEECAASSEQLANQSEALMQMLAKYRLRNNGRTNRNAAAFSASASTPRAAVERDNESIISLEGDFGKY